MTPASVIAWLTGKTVAIAFAVAALIAVPVAVVKTVQLDGLHVPIVGWTIVAGAKDTIADLNNSIFDPKTGYRAQLTRASDNLDRVQNGLNTCNASVDGLHTEAADLRKKYDALAAALGPKLRQLQSTISAIDAAKPGADLCTSFDDLMKGAYQ